MCTPYATPLPTQTIATNNSTTTYTAAPPAPPSHTYYSTSPPHRPHTSVGYFCTCRGCCAHGKPSMIEYLRQGQTSFSTWAQGWAGRAHAGMGVQWVSAPPLPSSHTPHTDTGKGRGMGAHLQRAAPRVVVARSGGKSAAGAKTGNRTPTHTRCEPPGQWLYRGFYFV